MSTSSPHHTECAEYSQRERERGRETPCQAPVAGVRCAVVAALMPHVYILQRRGNI